MNAKLAHVLEWARSHDVDLDRAQIQPSCYDGIRVTFSHSEETPDSFRALKRAIGGFPPIPVGESASIIRAEVGGEEHTISIQWYGAYTCEPTTNYNCTPVAFPKAEYDDPDVTVENTNQDWK